ncbi:MAG TPA: complex I NDUFA9 subunit family protein [Dehalococcoidia bacterium]|nr:complex I NDUFA9 subunit family protein [Dehalococcoidia bacterium]
MILVAGGTGFVGGGIVRELARRGKPVAALTRDPAKHSDRFPGLGVELRRGDVTDPASLAAALAGVDTVVASHQFPNSPIEDPKKGYTFEKVDAEGTENLARAAKDAGVSRFVYLSGAGAAPDAERHWFRAKWRAESAVRDSGITFTIIRPSWVFGPEDVALNRFLGMSRLLPFVPLIGNAGRQRLQPVFVDDVARAVAESLDNPAAENRTFEIGGPAVLTMKEIVRTALDVAGRRRLLLAAPKPVMKLAAGLLQFAPGRPLTPAAVDFITTDALADPSEIEAALGIKVTPLREALGTYLSPS